MSTAACGWSRQSYTDSSLEWFLIQAFTALNGKENTFALVVLPHASVTLMQSA